MAFQSKSREKWPEELLGTWRKPHDPGHWRLTAALLGHGSFRHFIDAALPRVRPGALRFLLAASAAHHGRPPDADDWERGIDPAIGDAALALAREIFVQVTGLLPPPRDVVLKRVQAHRLSWQVSGLITLADWVGSDAKYFGSGTPLDLPAYLEEARVSARRALADKGITPATPCAKPGLSAVAPEIAAPHPMQSWADRVELPEGPCLAIVEDVTGSGKTEAALALRLVALDLWQPRNAMPLEAAMKG